MAVDGIYMDPAQATLEAHTIRQAGYRYNEATMNVMNAARSISQSDGWVGIDSESFVAAVLSYETKLQELGNTIMQYAESIDTHVGDMGRLQAEISNQATNL